jgi:hypothetical protein
MKKTLLVFALFFIAAGAAHAADFFSPRTVTVRPSAGECMGKTNDPLCVFDTVVACAVRRDARLCASVGLAYDDFFQNALADLAGKDYAYAPVEIYVNRRTAACAYDNDKACALNPATNKIVPVGMSVKDNNNVAVYLKREKDGHWSVIFATQYACWSDEECS